MKFNIIIFVFLGLLIFAHVIFTPIDHISSINQTVSSSLREKLQERDQYPSEIILWHGCGDGAWIKEFELTSITYLNFSMQFTNQPYYERLWYNLSAQSIINKGLETNPSFQILFVRENTSSFEGIIGLMTDGINSIITFSAYTTLTGASGSEGWEDNMMKRNPDLQGHEITKIIFNLTIGKNSGQYFIFQDWQVYGYEILEHSQTEMQTTSTISITDIITSSNINDTSTSTREKIIITTNLPLFLSLISFTFIGIFIKRKHE